MLALRKTRGIVRFWKVNATSRVVHRQTIISDFIIITYFGKVNESYTIVAIPLALSNRFFGRRTLPGGNGVFNGDISVFSIDKCKSDRL